VETDTVLNDIKPPKPFASRQASHCQSTVTLVYHSTLDLRVIKEKKNLRLVSCNKEA